MIWERVLFFPLASFVEFLWTKSCLQRTTALFGIFRCQIMEFKDQKNLVLISCFCIRFLGHARRKIKSFAKHRASNDCIPPYFEVIGRQKWELELPMITQGIGTSNKEQVICIQSRQQKGNIVLIQMPGSFLFSSSTHA